MTIAGMVSGPRRRGLRSGPGKAAIPVGIYAAGDGSPVGPMAFEVPVLQFNAGALRRLGMEPNFDLAGHVGVGHDAPLRGPADVPALGAVHGSVNDVAAHPGLEYSLGDWRTSRLCSGGLKSPNCSVNTENARSIAASTTTCRRTAVSVCVMVVLSVLRSVVTFRWGMGVIGQDFGVTGERSPPVGVELVAQRSQSDRVELVDVPRPFLVLLHQARVLKHLQVLGAAGRLTGISAASSPTERGRSARRQRSRAAFGRRVHPSPGRLRSNH